VVRVGLARDNRSYEAVRGALEAIREDVRVPKELPVLIKPNLVSDTVELAATPVDAVRATMDFLMELGVERFVVGEGTAGEKGDTMGAFERFGYLSLKEHYDVELRDLNQDEHVAFEALDAGLKPVTIHLYKSYFNSYVVSVARMKTHLQVIVTLSLKNVAIGAINNPDRHSLAWHVPQPGAFSHDPQPLNLYIARVCQVIPPGLAVIDGVVGMDGNRPVNGAPVSSGVALASTDALAADVVGTELMGFDPRTIGYLWYLTQLRGLSREDIGVVGEDPSTCITRYKEYDRMAELLTWWVENWKGYLEGSYLRP